MGAYTDLVTKLTEQLSDTILLIPDPRVVGELDPEKTGFAQLIRTSVEASEYPGRWLTGWELWVCTPKKDLPEAEAALTDLLDEVLVILDTECPWLEWSRAERLVHDDNYHGFRIPFTTAGSTEQ